MSRRNHPRFTASPALVFQMVRKDAYSDRLKFNSRLQKALQEGRLVILLKNSENAKGGAV